MAEEFEQMIEKCLEQEEKKKSTYHFIEQKEAELLSLEVALLKEEADIEIEERKTDPVNSMVKVFICIYIFSSSISIGNWGKRH